jgi:hypothetical protein
MVVHREASASCAAYKLGTPALVGMNMLQLKEGKQMP